jgi:hypothetical protein
MYTNHSTGQQQPSTSSLTSCLKQLLEDARERFIIIDALDECKDRTELLKLIEQINGWENYHLHLLATSRKETDIYESLSPLVSTTVCIQNEDTKGDIRLYVNEEIKRDRVLQKRPPGVRKDIEATLIKRANGMWVDLY